MPQSPSANEEGFTRKNFAVHSPKFHAKIEDARNNQIELTRERATKK
jgi:hypothetical protein